MRTKQEIEKEMAEIAPYLPTSESAQQRYKELLLEEHDVVKDVIVYRLSCQYRDSSTSTFNSKLYTFSAYEPHIPGELVVVKDRYGYSLVKVVLCEMSTVLKSYSCVVDINEVNENAKLAYKREQMQNKIREALIIDIEKNAFERLAASHPELKETLDEFKQLGGSYTELMPSIKNLIGDIK